jgi:FkbM family methyltransferase
VGYGLTHFINGWWCPDILSGPGSFLRRAEDLPRALARLPKARSCVQAGGHIGIYPRLLSPVFERVYTFEPEAQNFSCLVKNNESDGKIFPMRAFLGAERGGRAIRQHPKSSGGHSLGDVGAIPMFPIDDLNLQDCDALFLDVEGTEYDALRGAFATIKRCKPMLVLEENKKMHSRGRVAGDLENLVAPFGYKVVDRFGEDIVLCSR